mmetsp:Transcript_12803/g.35421  ORF Transcript_12803/g.35421 Transcript_12803/m.35421 type:complete len:350 (-) Transcript_12803:142-1191(-)
MQACRRTATASTFTKGCRRRAGFRTRSIHTRAIVHADGQAFTASTESTTSTHLDLREALPEPALTLARIRLKEVTTPPQQADLAALPLGQDHETLHALALLPHLPLKLLVTSLLLPQLCLQGCQHLWLGHRGRKPAGPRAATLLQRTRCALRCAGTTGHWELCLCLWRDCCSKRRRFLHVQWPAVHQAVPCVLLQIKLPVPQAPSGLVQGLPCCTQLCLQLRLHCKQFLLFPGEARGSHVGLITVHLKVPELDLQRSRIQRVTGPGRSAGTQAWRSDARTFLVELPLDTSELLGHTCQMLTSCDKRLATVSACHQWAASRSSSLFSTLGTERLLQEQDLVIPRLRTHIP